MIYSPPPYVIFKLSKKIVSLYDGCPKKVTSVWSVNVSNILGGYCLSTLNKSCLAYNCADKTFEEI